MEKLWSVYKHTFPNNKCYIGIVAGKPEYRWGENGKRYGDDQPIIQNAIKKYGWDNIKHEILFTDLTKEEADLKEKEMIEFYHSYINDGGGYNGTRGGNGGLKVDYSKVKELWELGKSCSEIGRILGHDRHCIIRALNNMGYDTNVKKKIAQYSLDDNLIKIYNSITEASNTMKIDGSSISRCARGKSKTAGGYKWKYLNEHLTYRKSIEK